MWSYIADKLPKRLLLAAYTRVCVDVLLDLYPDLDQPADHVFESLNISEVGQHYMDAHNLARGVSDGQDAEPPTVALRAESTEERPSWIPG